MILLGYNTSGFFFKVFIGLFLSYIFYDNVIKLFNFDLNTLFKWYLKGALWVSYIGLFQLISWLLHFKKGYELFGLLNKWGISPGGIFGIRINSIYCEPTHYGAFMAAAFFAAVYSILPIKKNMQNYYNIHEAVIVIVIYFLTSSGLAQYGILLTGLLLFLHFGVIRYFVVFIPIIILGFNIIYNNVDEFKQRMDGLVDLFIHNKFTLGKTHGSSFILYNNYVVAFKNFWSNPVFGTGIGSHPVAFEKYSLAKNFKVEGFNNNSRDANSMFLRLVSETGLFGTTLFLVLTFKGFVRRQPDIPDHFWVISSGCLIIILLNLFRQGHYFFNGFPFYFLLYIYNKIKFKEFIQNQKV
ncbi:MAG: hypothetical protein N3F09_08265 [Bacteroidia bacterium]|nr:hypothetical protein [Bacteroidia bacterium]